MVKEAGTRKCSHCGQNGHNSRTCNGIKNGLKLFGVTILEKQKQTIKKSLSLGNLDSLIDKNSQIVEDGYSSDGYIGSNRDSASHGKKKGNPWSEEEHRVFLAGLKKLGKGDWKGISKKYVRSRTPTQVASHAQKYFQRKASSSSSSDNKNRRSSLFDITLKDSVLASQKSPELPFITSSPQASDSSSALPLENTTEIPTNEETPVKIMNQFPHLWLNNYIAHPPIAAWGVPNYSGIPYMLPKPVPNIMNYENPMVAYSFMPYNCAANAPKPAHSSAIPTPESLLPLASSTTKKDSMELDLKIGPPPEPSQGQGASLATQDSGPISVL
ncbi:probable transcription factor At5g61620 [Euphorbia lathyris]|uniref:probable transcription factor At5g61620 n=1 Tax=Euphorbia lathyris TaxID=212925 RepID=UPI0033143A2A